MLKSIKDILKTKPSSLLLLIMAVATLVTAYFNYQNHKPIISIFGILISAACLIYFFKEISGTKKDNRSTNRDKIN